MFDIQSDFRFNLEYTSLHALLIQFTIHSLIVSINAFNSFIFVKRSNEINLVATPSSGDNDRDPDIEVANINSTNDEDKECFIVNQVFPIKIDF